MVALWDWLFGTRPDSQPSRMRWGLIGALASTWLLLAFLVSRQFRGPSIDLAPDTIWLYVRTQAEVVLHYLRLAFVPSPLVFFYDWPLMPAPVWLAWQAAVLGGVLLWFRGSSVELFSRNFLNVRLLGEFFPRFVNGAKNTLILSVLGGVLGMVLGLILALFSMSKRAVVRAPARLYINFFRGTPLIWQLSFAGLGVVTALKLNFFSGMDGPYRVAVAVLGLNLAAYSAEVYRAGIQSLERGQMEAARSLGLSYLQAMRFVVVPQAIRRVIPPLTNEFVILIKDTSLVVVLGLAFNQKELLGAGREIYSSTFNATAWLGSAAGYLIITLPMIRLVTYLERKLRSGLTSVIG